MKKTVLLADLDQINTRLNSVLSVMRSEAYTDNIIEITPVLLQVDEDIESVIESLHCTATQLISADYESVPEEFNINFIID